MLPLVQGLFQPLGRVIGCSHVSGLVVRLLSAAGRYGDTRIRSKSLRRARRAHCPVLVFQPRSSRSFAHTGRCSPHTAPAGRRCFSKLRPSEPDNPLRGSASPRQPVPSCLQERWPPASLASGPACAPTRTQAGCRFDCASARQTLPP